MSEQGLYWLLAGQCLAVLVGFSLYDIKYRRVPDRALAFFIPLAGFSMLVQMVDTGAGPGAALLRVCLGLVCGGGILLLVAFVTSGKGIGGGDIKFTALLGAVIGPEAILQVQMVKYVIVIVVCLVHWGFTGVREFRAPFIPFLTLGCVIWAALTILLQ